MDLEAGVVSQSSPHFLMLEMMAASTNPSPTDDDIYMNSTLNTSVTPELESTEPVYRYTLIQMIILSIFAILLSILTTLGNIMVMVSFKIDKQLQTISNYFLFSLAVADFAIGIISIPLFSISTILGYWPFGAIVCDSWLALDYLASNASVLNLLIISFDRYFSVTRPLTYRAKRTTKRATAMIAAAWIISLILWPPWIYSWPYIEGKRTVPENECYIQFIETNQYITFGTAIAAFYFPVSVMCFLYYKIWRETKKRQKDLPNLQAGKKDSSKRSNSSDENTAVNHHQHLHHISEHETWRRPRSESSADAESIYMTNVVIEAHFSRRSSMATASTKKKKCFGGIKEWCIAWWHSGREDSDDYHYELEDPSDLGYATPMSIETPLQSSVPRCTSLNVMNPYSNNLSNNLNSGTGQASRSPGGSIYQISDSPQPKSHQHQPHHQSHYMPSLGQLQEISGPRESRSLPNNNNNTSNSNNNSNNRLGVRSVSQDSVYTILIRLPPDGGKGGDEQAPSIKMIQDDVPTSSSAASAAAASPSLPTNVPPPPTIRRPLPSRDSEYSLPLGRRMSHAQADLRIPLNAKVIPKNLSKPPLTARQAKKKKKTQEKRQESKAAKTLSAILLSFIITWTPYNILVLIKPLTSCGDKCIPKELWDFFYALCYINSTINPVCYALCNASFRQTYIRILTCKWQSRNREAMVRGVYN